jgi:hypothetical protein
MVSDGGRSVTGINGEATGINGEVTACNLGRKDISENFSIFFFLFKKFILYHFYFILLTVISELEN